ERCAGCHGRTRRARCEQARRHAGGPTRPHGPHEGSRRARVLRHGTLQACPHSQTLARRFRRIRVNLHTDLSFVTLIAHASFIVQAVIALLAVLSLWSWCQIFLKLFQLRRQTRETSTFEDEFWKGGDLSEL